MPSDSKPRLVIIGSINMDLVLRVPRMPRPGETLLGDDLQLIPGGKGANQAVAAARLQADSTMIGRVGDDVFGERLRRNLEADSVHVEHIQVTESCSSGVAVISVDSSGQNSITIVGGANARLRPEDLRPLEPTLQRADAVILQLEIPLDTVQTALSLARKHEVTTILDPAPAPLTEMPHDLYRVDILSPNQVEAESLSGQKVETLDDARRAARELLRRGARNVVLKLGPAGALAANTEVGTVHVEAYPVDVVDTTAAGDAFTAALALKRAQGFDLVEATQFACAAGSLAASRFGAQPSMPALHEVQSLMTQHAKS